MPEYLTPDEVADAFLEELDKVPDEKWASVAEKLLNRFLEDGRYAETAAIMRRSRPEIVPEGVIHHIVMSAAKHRGDDELMVFEACWGC